MTSSDPDCKRMELWQAMLQAQARVCAALTRHLQAECDLPLKWYHILVYLDHQSCGSLRLQDLAVAIGVSQSGLTRLLDRMTEAGLVQREPCQADRRGMYAVITPAGRTAVEQARPLYQRCVEEYFMQHFELSEIEALRKSLTKVLTTSEALEPSD